MVRSVRKILVAFDGSQNSIRGLERAIQIAKPSRATVTAMYVISPLSKSSFYSVTSTQRNTARQKAIEILDKASGRAKIAGVKFQVKLVNGIPASTITQFADSQKFDMIVIGARGLSKTKAAFLGSVSNHILHSAKIPVLVVK
jgi:nucleotide-binding universal stress UspA family protein